jgi:sulfotransferase famil protein
MTRRPVLLYLHIPKTAGESLTKHIFDHYNDATGSSEEGGWFSSGVYYFPGQLGFMRRVEANYPDDVVQALRRSDLRAAVGHFSFGLHLLIDEPITYATMVRHPVERILSLYCHLKRWPSYDRYPPWLERVGLRPLEADTSLDEFIRNYPLRELDNDQTRRVAGKDPGYGSCSPRLLDMARSNIERFFSFVGVTERFEESLQVVADVLGWSLEFPAYKKNVNEQRAPTSSVPPETKAAILERNTLDLELYSFANEWLDGRLRSIRV